MILGAETANWCHFGSRPAEEVLVHSQQCWKCDRLSVSGVGILGLIVL